MTLGKSLFLTKPQSPYPMLPSLLGFNGVVSKTNQDANNLEGGSWDGVDRHRAFIGGQTPPHLCFIHIGQGELLMHHEWGAGKPSGPGSSPLTWHLFWGVGVRMLMIVLCYCPPITAL